MKILGGEFRNRIFKAPKGTTTRPTTSLVRKALFDICQTSIQDAHVLDLFAGSGAIGIEALSRGAAHATFIERDPTALACLRENIKTFQIADRCTLISGDVFKHLPRLATTYNLIVADPPYKANVFEELLKQIEKYQLLALDGVLFLEAQYPSELPQTNLFTFPSRRYSTTVLHHLTRLK